MEPLAVVALLLTAQFLDSIFFGKKETPIPPNPPAISQPAATAATADESK